MKSFFYFTGLIFFCFFVKAVYSQTAPDEIFCVNAKEKALYKLINDYRKSKKLPVIPLSPELCKVAKIHLNDLADNNPVTRKCNLHSWSDKGRWKPCCYTDDHKNAGLMWSKPSELTSYKSEGYEIAFESSAGAGPEEALAVWKTSPGHNSVIIEKGVFNKIKWQAVGIAVEGNYALVWFGEIKDNSTPLEDCE